MTPADSNQNRSISIGRDAIGNVIQTGDNNTAAVQFQQATLPQPESINMQAELIALKAVLSQLDTPDRRKIENAISDAEEELKKSDPDKDEVGQALDRALNYATKANGFAEAIDKLRPHVEKTAAWLGQNWHKVLAVVGLAV
jgi:tRNA splicing ligase